MGALNIVRRAAVRWGTTQPLVVEKENQPAHPSIDLVTLSLEDRIAHMMEMVRAAFPSEQESAKFFSAHVRKLVERDHHTSFMGDRMMTLDKIAGFLDDKKFADAYKEIHGIIQYDQYDSSQTIAWRLHTLVWAAQRGARLAGDFVECGVYKGHMAWVVSQMVSLDACDKEFYLYDTYAGFDTRYSSPADFPQSPNTFAQNDAAYKEPGIYESVVARFANQPRVKVIKGVVPDIFDVIEPKQIAFLHVDLNSAVPETHTFERFFDRVSPGGTIVLDDYGWYLHRPQYDAANAFFNARGYEVLELPTGQGLVIK